MATQTHRLEKEMKQTHTAEVQDNTGTYEVVVTMNEQSNRHEVTEVTVRSLTEGAVVTQKLLRSISIMDSVRAISSLGAVNENTEGAETYDLSPLTKQKWVSSDEQLKLVAQLYRDAYKAHVPVQGYIASRVNRPVSSVNRWIRLAREGGFLGKSNGTRGGEM